MTASKFKLTRKRLMSLQHEQVIVSNICSTPDGVCRPVFAEMVVPLDDRPEQWDRVKQAGADGRLCYVLPRGSETPRSADALIGLLGD